jgi:hypothetical protein
VEGVIELISVVSVTKQIGYASCDSISVRLVSKGLMLESTDPDSS